MSFKLLWQQIANLTICELFCLSEADGIVFDTEHGVYDNESLLDHIRLAKLFKKMPLVRVTELNKTLIRMCLDSGAMGIILSTVEDGDISWELNMMAFYPPKGHRGVGLVRENRWGDLALCNTEPILIAQIESSKGIENIDGFSKYYDYFMIGPYDLTADLGCPGEFENKKFNRAIQLFECKIPPKKRAFHIVKPDMMKEEYKDYPLLAYGLDTLIIKDGAKCVLS